MDIEYKELKEQVYKKLHSITPYVANLLQNDKLYTPPGDFNRRFFAMYDTRYCIAGWAHKKNPYYAQLGNPKYCEKCDKLGIEMYEMWDGKQSSKRLLKSILKFTEHFKSTHK